MRRWIVFVPVAILAFFSTPLEARATGGLNVTAYVFDSFPPLRQDGVYPVCNTLVYENIQQGWGNGDVAGCLYQHDRVMLHYEGNIVIPEDAPYVQFLVMSDDGGVIDIAGGSYGFWGDRGCSYSASPVLYLPTNTEIPFDAWFYENGGGTCFYLYWNIGNGFEVVPPSAFSAPVPTTTTSTTTLPPTTLPETTTTVEESTTTSATTTSSSSSSVPESSSSSSSSSSVAETSSSVSSSSVVETSIQQPSVQQTSSTIPDEPSTTTTLHDFVPEPAIPTEPVPTPQQPVPESTAPETTTPVEPTEDTAFVQDTVVEVTIPENVTVPSIEIIDDEESAPETTNPPVEDAVTSPPDTIGSDLSVVEPETVSDTGEYTEEQISEAIVAIINNDPSEITTEQVAILTSPEVFEKLSDAQLEMVAETLSSASDEVKELFEESIDIFSGKVDNYIPLGSTVSVGKRRVLNAVTATLFVMSVPIPVTSASASASAKGSRE